MTSSAFDDRADVFLTIPCGEDTFFIIRLLGEEGTCVIAVMHVPNVPGSLLHCNFN